MQLSSNYKGKSYSTSKGSTWRSQMPMCTMQKTIYFSFKSGWTQKGSTWKNQILLYAMWPSSIHQGKSYPSPQGSKWGSQEGTEKSRLMYDCGAHPAYGRHHLKKLRNLDMTQITNLTPSKKTTVTSFGATVVQYFLNVVPIFWGQDSDCENKIDFSKYLFHHLRCHNLYCLALSQCQIMHILSPKY